MSQSEKRVLICDDEPAILESVRYVVKKQGLGYQLAINGDEAIRLARENLPDIILLDWNMPGLTGIEVCEKLKRDNKTSDIYIIMLTANAQAGEIVEGLNAGANRYVEKPFSPRHLGGILKEAVVELNQGKER